MIDRGHRRVITSRALVNAGRGRGPHRSPKPCCGCRRQKLAAIQISQIIVRRLFETDNVYVFQNVDRRLIFASPYPARFYPDRQVTQPASRAIRPSVPMAATDVAYLCDAANRYFRERVEPSDVIRSVSGANIALDPATRRATRDGTTNFEAPARPGAAADDVRRRHHHLAAARRTGGFPAHTVLSDVAALDREGVAAGRRFRLGTVRCGSRRRAGTLALPWARIRGAAPGRRLWLAACDGAGRGPDPRPTRSASAGATAAEVRYLMAHEWARFPDDILWRRTKLGLTMQAEGIAWRWRPSWRPLGCAAPIESRTPRSAASVQPGLLLRHGAG